MVKKIVIKEWERKKKPTINKGDTVIQNYAYTIETEGKNLGKSTLYRGLPKGYMIEGKVVKLSKNKHFQNHKATRIEMERISKSPKGKRLRKKYIIWQLEDGKVVR